ncbi:Predicted house-cleaning noncanonical NTP pyrophosphatase, all-alpha NTP-PPase (MazG) superfamily [Natronincola peptidivorans]|uniref:Predicted house-cleaning noncanonical NTP pyrophosphatase, all-alpha NTP-PPase (MazG) superfamily n=1 Tax=Natronincola peptidivorans TaxID=426128 RepID=A0A1I0H0C6_9FIRM|nr:nucleoside triphosphate pyrophosphohydrolase [Natronincola peptidivorans]SET77133.1 Predicted house-cleaning noncanonical NTP pyrophosphatase, all-alpha NTP-PPase (MazG) superfamily [Natronincola peptidivorans]
MSEKIYNKLVRDDIPKAIEENNKKCETEIVKGEELKQLLNEKLQEEVQEYLETNDVEELTDIVEVIHGILHHRNVTMKELEDIRIKKKEERGGFTKGVKLVKVY